MNSSPRLRSPSSTSSSGLAGAVRRAARASARRPKLTIVLWLALVVGLVAAGSLTGTKELEGSASGVGESGTAERLIEDANLDDPATESILVRSPDASTSTDAAAALAGRLRRVEQVAAVTGPGASGQVADDGRALLVQATLRGAAEKASGKVGAITRSVRDVARSHPEASFDQAGMASLENAADDIVTEDLERVELFSLPLILVILLITFGALVAASVPLILGITAVAGAMGAAGLVSQIAPDGGTTGSMIVLIGLAVGVDYSLFYIRREREERRAGKGADATLDATASTVGRAIVVSGATVIVALAGLLFTGMAVFASLALGTMVVVALAVIGSITVLPAILQLLGERVERGRIPFIGRRRPATPGHGFWPRLMGLVSRRPGVSLVASGCLLVALALPATGMHLGETSEGDLPDGGPAVDALRSIEATFPGAPGNARLVVSRSGLETTVARDGLLDLGRRALDVTGGSGPIGIEVAADGGTAAVDVPMPDVTRDQATAIVETLRRDVAATMARADVLVTGEAAASADFTTALRDAMPIVVGLVLALAFVLLLAAFRSPWLAASVIGLNLLSVGAAYGVLTAIFQNHWAEDLLGFTSGGFIVSWVPLFAFVILFGLSMDYTVIVLERIRESRIGGRSVRDAVAEGVGATAGAVTSAAVVMVAVFSIFALMRMPEMKQLGVGLGVAILLDATIVRGVALPAAVALLGERGWRLEPRTRRQARRGASIKPHAESAP